MVVPPLLYEKGRCNAAAGKIQEVKHMIIKNIGAKIISIGSTVLMPDAEMKASKDVAETPAIQAFVRLGFVKVEDGEEEKAAKKVADEAAAKKAAEDAAKKAEEEAKKKAADEAAAKKTAKSAEQSK